jgi:hypothetical protein
MKVELNKTMNPSMKIFNNPIPEKVIKKAQKQKTKFLKKYGNDLNTIYHLKEVEHSLLTPSLGIHLLKEGESQWEAKHTNPIIIGNIRMGYGHYRISFALASCAKALGYTPYWFDLPSFEKTTGAKIIRHLNSLYSMGSRWSQKYSLFNHFYWEPLNYEGFKKLSYNASDQIMSTCFTPIYHDLNSNIPFVATHVWPAQAAIHAGIKTVINVIPDNWPMALHLSEGSVHTTQTYSATMGYKLLRGMDGNTILNPMGDDDIKYCGHYVDHELVSNLVDDTQRRLNRIKHLQAKRILMTIGGAGAQGIFYAKMIKALHPKVKNNEVVLFINVGDHHHVLKQLIEDIPELNTLNVQKHEHWSSTIECVTHANQDKITGIHLFYHQDIMEAVYSTNILMRESDILVTKPSELSFYPIPKCFVKRVGGHEMWGAIHSSELGDGSVECDNIDTANQMMTYLLDDTFALKDMNERILQLHDQKLYHGAYNAIACCDKM